MSCDVYYHICATYDIDGYPTLIGWKQGQSATDGGTVLNEDGDIDAESVAQTLDLDLAQEETSVDAEPEDEEERQRVRETRARQGREAAAARLRRHGHEPRTRNARYHDAALSLAFAVRSQLFQTATAAEGGASRPGAGGPCRISSTCRSGRCPGRGACARASCGSCGGGWRRTPCAIGPPSRP